MFLFQLKFGKSSEKTTTLIESQQIAKQTVETAYKDKVITKNERDDTIKTIDNAKTKDAVIKALDNLARTNENFRKYYQDFLSIINQQVQEKTKESQSPFMQNPDPNLVYAQGRGITDQIREEKEKVTDQGEAFWTTKESKNKKKAA